MTGIPLGALIGGGIVTLAAPAGPAAGAVGVVLTSLLALGALALALGGRRLLR
jgi:hypothetical protein